LRTKFQGIGKSGNPLPSDGRDRPFKSGYPDQLFTFYDVHGTMSK